jgi:hypothetical protein
LFKFDLLGRYRFGIGIMTISLQIYNIAVLNWFWPFFAGIVVHLMAAILQFMRLVLLPQRNQPAPSTRGTQNEKS